VTATEPLVATLPDDLVAWVEAEAARRGVPADRLLVELVSGSLPERLERLLKELLPTPALDVTPRATPEETNGRGLSSPATGTAELILSEASLALPVPDEHAEAQNGRPV